jgi:hypothetical protein
MSAQAQWEQEMQQITAAFSKAFNLNSTPASQPAR